ncbi:MAG: hypothetical protein QXN68_04415 [Thermoplasmata archaeon]
MGISIIVLICALLFLPRKNDIILKASQDNLRFIVVDKSIVYDKEYVYFLTYDKTDLEQSSYVAQLSGLELGLTFNPYRIIAGSWYDYEYGDIEKGQIYSFQGSGNYLHEETNIDVLSILLFGYSRQDIEEGSYLDGYNNGYSDGLDIGYDNGYSDGYDEGLLIGEGSYSDGYDDGFIDGLLSGVKGNNLIRGTLNEYVEVSWTGWGTYPYNLSSYYLDSIRQGGTYTMSAYVDNQSSFSKISLIFIAYRTDNSYIAFRSDYEVNQLSEGYIYYTFTVPADSNYDLIQFGFFSSEQTGTKTIRYKQVKLEHGEEATPWSPSIYDVNQKYYENGYNEGHWDGYLKGVSEDKGELGFWEIIPKTVTTVWNDTVMPIFNFDFFGVKILDIWTGLVAIAVAIFLIKWWK